MMRGARAGLSGALLFCLAHLCLAQEPAAVAWSIEPVAREAGYKVETALDDATLCAVIRPPSKPLPGQSAGMARTVNADAYRGKTLRFSAWLRVQSAGSKDNARLWMRINRPNTLEQSLGLFDNQTDEAVASPDWTRSEITLTVNADAETVTFGVLSTGAGTVWAKELSLLIIDDVESRSSGPEPANLKFSEGAPNVTPSGWSVLPGAAYKANRTARGCHIGPPCAVLSSSAKAPANAWGALIQTFSAANYRGRTVRLRASVHPQPDGKDDHVRLWLRTGRAGEKVNASNLFDHMDYREFRSRDWTPGEIVRKIDDNIEEISIGVMLMGKGRVAIDEVYFSVIPDAPIRPVTTSTSLAAPRLADDPANSPPFGLRSPVASLAGPLPETNWPSLPVPSHEEQRQTVNGAASHAMRYVQDLPNFLCSLLIRRSENRNDGGWRERDVLDVQLGFSEKTEYYKLRSVNGRPTNAPYRSVGGAITEGDFGSVMAEIFRPRSADFHWDHWTTLRNRVAHVFRYQITALKAAYELQFGPVKGKPVSTITAHHGYVYIEKGTNNILRIEQIADPPAGFPLRYAVNVIDYDWSDVGGRQVLLPLRAEITMGSTYLRSFNTIRFHDYRKFSAESQITFEQP